jgi:hypothetical protein
MEKHENYEHIFHYIKSLQKYILNFVIVAIIENVKDLFELPYFGLLFLSGNCFTSIAVETLLD